MNLNAEKIIEILTKRDNSNVNAHDIIILAMELIDSSNINGNYKSNIVINILKNIILNNQLNLQPNVINDIKILIDNNLIQQTIDSLYNASIGSHSIGLRNPAKVTYYITNKSNIFGNR